MRNMMTSGSIVDFLGRTIPAFFEKQGRRLEEYLHPCLETLKGINRDGLWVDIYSLRKNNLVCDGTADIDTALHPVSRYKEVNIYHKDGTVVIGRPDPDKPDVMGIAGYLFEGHDVLLPCIHLEGMYHSCMSYFSVEISYLPGRYINGTAQTAVDSAEGIMLRLHQVLSERKISTIGQST